MKKKGAEMKLPFGVDLKCGATDGYGGDWEHRPALNPPVRFDHPNAKRKRAQRRDGYKSSVGGRKVRRGFLR